MDEEQDDELYNSFKEAFHKVLHFNTVENRNRVYLMFIDQMKRTTTAERRMAELEAEQGWRPVTEPPTDEVFAVFLYDPNDILHPGGLYARWYKGLWLHNHPITPTHWRPIPPPPATE